MSDGCNGPGGAVFTVEGPQFGPQMVEAPCPLCKGWHLSPEERASEERRRQRQANPGPLRRIVRRIFIGGDQ